MTTALEELRLALYQAAAAISEGLRLVGERPVIDSEDGGDD